MAVRKKSASKAGAKRRVARPAELRRASDTVFREIDSITKLTDARTSALDSAINDLEAKGVQAVPQVLDTYGQHLTPQERTLLENATDRDIQTLIQTSRLLKKFNPISACI